MKVIVAGSRSIEDWMTVHECLSLFNDQIEEVVSGTAIGPDGYGEDWAEERDIPVKRFVPDWKTYGKAAGAIRNAEMGEYADALIAFWDGKSRGTKHMIEYMMKKKKEVHVYFMEASETTISKE